MKICEAGRSFLYSLAASGQALPLTCEPPEAAGADGWTVLRGVVVIAAAVALLILLRPDRPQSGRRRKEDRKQNRDRKIPREKNKKTT